jgi:hypothetical protein
MESSSMTALVKRIDGWKAISDRLTLEVGFEVSIDRCRRWSMRNKNPFPVKRFGTIPFVDERDLIAWVKSQIK